MTITNPMLSDHTSDHTNHKYSSVAPSCAAGIGLRTAHYRDILEQKPDIGWIEVHPENYFGGGAHRHYLNKARELYPLSLHAVGLSLGAPDAVSEEHLKQFKELIDIYEPFQISDHASWTSSGNAHLNDLLPLPYTKESLQNICRNIDQTQNFFGQKILVENPSSYMRYAINEMDEPAFMNELAKRTGCGILLDINNIYVQANNHNFDAKNYIDQISPDYVGEMHLAGHIEHDVAGQTLFIDTHNQPVKEDVWNLYSYAAQKFANTPSLIEWDSDLPALSVLVEHADKAQSIIDRYHNAGDKAYA